MLSPANDRHPKLGLKRTGAVLAVLGRHLWPAGEWGLRSRVVVSMVLLVLAKIASVYVPLLYKHAVDALGSPAAQLVAVPVALIVAYGVARVLALALGEVRDRVFAPVAQLNVVLSAPLAPGESPFPDLRPALEVNLGTVDAVVLSGDLGKSAAFDEAIGAFAGS